MNTTRWRLLDENPSLRKPGWLPPPEVWPELAPFREQHERLLAACAAEAHAVMELHKRFDAEDKSRADTMKAAFLTGVEPTAGGQTPPDEREAALREAGMRSDAATDALVTFLQEAIGAIQQQASEWYGVLASRRAEAEAKREEARRILAEADRDVAETERMRLWLDRESGKSVLGHYPFDQIQAPTPQPGFDFMRPGATFTEVHDAA